MVKTPSSLKQIASGLNLDHPACVYVSISKSFRKKRQTICSEIIRVEREIRREKLVYRKKKKQSWTMVLFVRGFSLFDRRVIKCQVSNRIHRIGCALFVVILCLSSSASSRIFNSSSGNSTYVDRCRADCAVHKDLISCGKFRVVRWLNDIAREKVGFLFNSK